MKAASRSADAAQKRLRPKEIAAFFIKRRSLFRAHFCGYHSPEGGNPMAYSTIFPLSILNVAISLPSTVFRRKV